MPGNRLFLTHKHLKTMFVAKFNQVSADSDKFTADKNGNMPFIGTILAGKAKGSLINGTIFERDGLKTQKMYLCQNEIEEYTNPDTGEVTNQIRVVVLSEISPIEFIQVKKELGVGKLVVSSVEEAEEAELV